MNQAELIAGVAEKTGVAKATVKEVLTAMAELSTAALAAGDKVSLMSLGTLKTADRAARTGRNPKTGEEIQIAAKKVAKLKPSPSMDEALNA